MNYELIKSFFRRGRQAWLRARMRRCRPLPLPEGPVVIVAPHPDDEVIGCAGLIARLCAAGRPPHVLLLTNGEGSHRGCCQTTPDEVAAGRRRLTMHAAEILGLPADHLHWLGLPDGKIPEQLSGNPLSNLPLDLSTPSSAPVTIFVPHNGEGWPDHLNAARLGRQWAGELEADVYEYCVWMWFYMVRGLDWPNAFCLRLSRAERALKRRAVHAYIDPTGSCGKPWSGVLPTAFTRAAFFPAELYFM